MLINISTAAIILITIVHRERVIEEITVEEEAQTSVVVKMERVNVAKKEKIELSERIVVLVIIIPPNNQIHSS